MSQYVHYSGFVTHSEILKLHFELTGNKIFFRGNFFLVCPCRFVCG